MVGRVSGALFALALAAALFLALSPADPAVAACGPVTLDQIYPGFDVDGVPIPTTTTSTTTITTNSSIPSTDTTLPAGASSSLAGVGATLQAICRSWTYEMVYPVVYDNPAFSSFGADRDAGARLHRGVDIPAPKMTPVVAIADGIITAIRDEPEDCCWVMITHDDGWKSLYVHLNNDSYETDDGLGIGINPYVQEGSTILAGQVIGWVGDSGNAEDSVPHLHFELREPGGHSVDPGPSLKKAFEGSEFGTNVGPYTDDEGTAIEPLATWMASRGAFWPCDERGLELCPTRLAGPIGTVALMEQMTGLTPPSVEARRQSVAIEAFIPGELLSDIFGCGSPDSCMLSGISAGDLARQAHWLHQGGWQSGEPPSGPEGRSLALEQGPVAAPAITPLPDLATAEAGLRAVGAIGECHSGPDGDRLVDRAETLVLLNWWVNLSPPIPCRQGFDPDT